jgi:hypothetical protein
MGASERGSISEARLARVVCDEWRILLRGAIARHRGQAAPVTARYKRLARTQKQQLMTFLDSL